MNTVASEVFPAETPSIGTGNASATIADPSSASAPSDSVAVGGSAASAEMAIATRTSAASATATTKIRTRPISGDAGRRTACRGWRNPSVSHDPARATHCLRTVCAIGPSTTPQYRRIDGSLAYEESNPGGFLSSRTRVGGPDLLVRSSTATTVRRARASRGCRRTRAASARARRQSGNVDDAGGSRNVYFSDFAIEGDVRECVDTDQVNGPHEGGSLVRITNNTTVRAGSLDLNWNIGLGAIWL